MSDNQKWKYSAQVYVSSLEVIKAVLEHLFDIKNKWLETESLKLNRNTFITHGF